MSTSLIPIVPPGEDELPCSDGVPMETETHRLQMNLLIESLSLAWKDRNDFYVGGDMFLYFSEDQVRHNDFRGPDFFVVLDAVRRRRKSWVTWKEGRSPNVIVELLSESTEHIDRGEKMVVYAKQLRVAEYFLYDPLDHRLEGYALDTRRRRYRKMKPEPNGDFVCQQLGLRLGLRDGEIFGYERSPWLRFIDAEGRVLQTGDERAEEAEERASKAEAELRALKDSLAKR